jgi:hypothetical protein
MTLRKTRRRLKEEQEVKEIASTLVVLGMIGIVAGLFINAFSEFEKDKNDFKAI